MQFLESNKACGGDELWDVEIQFSKMGNATQDSNKDFKK